MKKIIFMGAVCSLLFAACHSDREANHSRENQKNPEHQDPNVVVFTKEQQAKIGLATETVRLEPFGQTIKTVGRIEPALADETVLPAKASGIVVFDNDWVEGMKVRAGRKLLTVAGAGTAEGNVTAQFAEATANYRKAEADFRRARELQKDQIVSEKEFLGIKSVYEATKAVYELMTENFSAGGQPVSSPVDGFIRRVYVSNGQFVNAGQPLASVSGNQSLFLKADVRMKYAPDLPAVASANFRAINGRRTYSLEELNGKLLSCGKAVNEENGMLPVTFRMDNRGDLLPGSLVEVFIRLQQGKPALTVPKASLMEEQGIYSVFVQHSPESFEKREVETGASDGIRTEIRSGLAAGDVVVTRGAVSVKLTQAGGGTESEAGHVH
ncbi:MAG: efflux RND transporter periplasmic adaptor subunit [Dysgonamonadaceae bacterium]|nr:efflux RND transporter periplasmic adaptor subunit [Dysgonamonadaceae bacterium]